jgi:hypothetical protein
MIKYADRILETSVTQGTGTLNLDGPTAGAQSFVAGVSSGSKVAYFIEDGTDWESGIGTVTSGTPDTLSRDTVLESSNADALVNWGPGTRNVFIGSSSHMMLWRDENKNDVNAVGVSGGTGNANTVTMTPVPLALSDKMIIRWRSPAANSGNVTVNVNSLGAKSYVNNDLSQFASGLIQNGTIQEAVYNLAEDRFERTTQLVAPASFATAAQGTIADGLLVGSKGRLLNGLTLANDTTDATNDIVIAAGSAVSDDGTTIITLPTSLIKRIDAAWAAGTNQGGRSSAAALTNATYFVYAVSKNAGADPDVIIDVSTTPTMPTNYTKKKYIGAIIYSSGILAFAQIGNQFALKTRTLDGDTTGPSTAGATINASVPVGIKVMGRFVGALNGSSTAYAVFTSPDETNNAASATNCDLVCSSTVGQTNIEFMRITNTSGQIRYRASTASVSFLRVWTLGWIDFGI